MRDTTRRFSPITLSLHWIVGLTIIGLTGLGLYMKNAESYHLYPFHKSVGVVIVVFVLLRVWWRVMNGWPAPVRQYAKFEQHMAHVVHWVLITGTILMPVSGFMHSAFSGHGVSVFGWEWVPMQLSASGEAVPYNTFLYQTGAFTHTAIGYALIVAISLHMLGACKHHFLDHDSTLLRMLGRADARR